MAKKREWGSNISIPSIFRLLGRMSSGKEGPGEGEIFLEENQDFNKGGWGRILSCWELSTALYYSGV